MNRSSIVLTVFIIWGVMAVAGQALSSLSAEQQQIADDTALDKLGLADNRTIRPPGQADDRINRPLGQIGDVIPGNTV
ncbi:hypothetical protein ANME2D_00141 [Candidatus Methanoperedens nitroreducens]|uniref:Uncharacterized protein n=1 Tax=Candidatus Methanoperedens nitratireducens TaxID=1392998 RepID=A0A062V6Z4_9EURY|nr:hypothetical protein [Candidatus Methanoperedens nitroreducens]KCZ73082.1 hypothetical protein ANME2D_00141 [Candidatus Methanoperedens nitroreducens]MDJ1422972.1 hypothetical protein [Candidatus Methanoperedens sp.]